MRRSVKPMAAVLCVCGGKKDEKKRFVWVVKIVGVGYLRRKNSRAEQRTEQNAQY